MLNLCDINPYIRVAMHSVLPRGHEIKRRIIYDYELIYIEDGELVFTYNDVEYHPKKGQFIFIRPNIPHSFSGITSFLSQPHIHFDITHFSDSAQVPVSFKDRPALTEQEIAMIRTDAFSDYPITPFVVFSDTARAVNLFYQVIDSGSAILKKARLIELFELLIHDNFANALRAENYLHPIEKQLKDYIDAGQGFTAKLVDFAKHFNYNKCYLEHRFKRRYGVGVIAYRNERRLQTAKELLTRFSVTEVSEKLCFSSIYVFSRAYKTRFGVSPANERKRKDNIK